MGWTYSYRSNTQKEIGKMEYSSLLRDVYSIMPPLRGVCSANGARTAENASEGVGGCYYVMEMNDEWAGTAIKVRNESGRAK